MREILFRGKSTDNGKWIEGQYIHLHKTTYCVKEDYDATPDNDIHQIVFEQMTDWGLPNEHLRADVDPSTVSQYVGLTDKSNTKIFEGDILKHPTGGIGVVAWDTQMCTFVFDYNFNEDTSYDCRWMYLYELSVNHSEVIGNIYDNPELLKENNNV